MAEFNAINRGACIADDLVDLAAARQFALDEYVNATRMRREDAG